MIIRRLSAVLWAAAVLLPAARAQFLQQGPKLTGIDGSGSPSEGNSVAISADGNTAIVGGYYDNSGIGAAFVYVRANGAWIQQGPKLVGSGSVLRSAQGWSVALSADGNTALIGGVGDGLDGKTGAVWVFTRTNGVWTQQGPKLQTEGLSQGRLVSLSGDGNTALVASLAGAAVFTRANGVWTRQPNLVGPDLSDNPPLIWSAALSADGNTAIVSADFDKTGFSAAAIFTRTDGVWTQQGPRLTASDQTNPVQYQGVLAGISADAGTAIVGRASDNNGVGAVWIFTRTNGTWSQQGPKLVGTGATGTASQGAAVSISGDGNTVLVGGPADNQGIGAAWAFTRANGVWTQLGSKLVGTGYVGTPPFSAPNQGFSVTLSGDGHTAIVGGPADQPWGAAWVFTSSPVHFAISAPTGVTAGTGFQFTVTALNPDNSAATGYNGTVHFTSADPIADLPADSTLTNGTGTFLATLKTGNFLNPTITATDTVSPFITGSSNPIAVFSSFTSRFVLSATPATAVSGVPFSFVVTAYDRFGNLTQPNITHLHFTSTDPAAILPSDSLLPSGVATFQAVLKTSGSQTITVTDATNSSVTGTSSLIFVVGSSTITNLALGKPASQSSTFHLTPGATAARAVDGNTDGNFYNNSVTATDVQVNPWWQVDLGSSASISSISLWNRTDCCGERLLDYWIFVSDTPFLATDTPANLQSRPGTWSTHPNGAPTPSGSIPVGAQGRYVRVQLGSSVFTLLSLAEVQVFGTAGSSAAASLAQGKPATQSSTLAGYSTDGASAAVDGVTDGNFFNGSVTATDLDANPWWQVDLQTVANVNSVVISNRTDCCGTRLSDYWVFVSSTPFLPTDTPANLQNRTGTFAIHQTSAPDPSAVINIGGASGFPGRYVRVQLSNSGYLSLAEVQVIGTGGAANAALNQTATQSSTLPGYVAGAGLAVDGNTSGAFFSGSVTATNADPQAWWQVDLGASKSIGSVVVWNRTDCCGTRLSNYWVFVSDTPFLATDKPANLQNRAGTFAMHLTTAPAPSSVITVGGAGRYVRIQLDGTDYLSLAEVQVFAQ